MYSVSFLSIKLFAVAFLFWC